jgi:hypothetical protein
MCPKDNNPIIQESALFFASWALAPQLFNRPAAQTNYCGESAAFKY